MTALCISAAVWSSVAAYVPFPILGLGRNQQQDRRLLLNKFQPLKIWKEQQVPVTNAVVSSGGLLMNSHVAACLSNESATLDRALAYDRLLPCPSYQLPLRIEHLFVERNGNVVDVICDALSLPAQYVRDLIEFGAVYHAFRCSEPPDNAPPQHMELYKRACLMKLPRVQGMSVGESQRSYRIVSRHEEVERGSYMRIHVHPRRFPRCYEVDWKSRIIADTDSFIVLDKPAGVSVGGSIDNLEESCVTFAARALNMPYSLLITHQIDNCTEGCVVLAKNKEFVSKFNRFLRTRLVDKQYCVLAAAPVPLGNVSHYMQPGNYAPRLVSKDAREGWHLCRMEVLECKEVPWPPESLLSKYCIRNCGWEKTSCAYECQVKLLTGRTHQVRAQFSALGAPVIGDTVYIPAAIARLQSPEVDPVLSIDSKWSEELEEEWILEHGLNAPEVAIGLQASSISWGEDECSFKAGSPWWRDNPKLQQQ